MLRAQVPKAPEHEVSNFCHSGFGLVSDFAFRISDFRLRRHHPAACSTTASLGTAFRISATI